MEKIIVLGGDGFCGWPISLRLSSLGYDVTIIDDLSRRVIDVRLGCNSLTPIRSLDYRVLKWRQLTGNSLHVRQFDVARDYEALSKTIEYLRPAAIIHLAEQRSAPYSMKGSSEKRYTVDNNISATNNLLVAVSDLGIDIHIVHIGTMGVYGYGGLENFYIPEGYVDMEMTCTVTGQCVKPQVMFPSDPGSVYHMTKVLDSQLFCFYNKNDGVRITDLHQGIVWGTQTEETSMHEALINRFDYDGDYGTVLNRFIMQGVIGHPITVYGSGERERAFIHIGDTAECIRLAIENPPSNDRVRIINQTTEQLNLKDLAEMISKRTGTEIQYCTNPRKEADKNNLLTTNKTLLDLGLNPRKLDDDGITEVFDVVEKYRKRVDTSKIMPTSFWTKKNA